MGVREDQTIRRVTKLDPKRIKGVYTENSIGSGLQIFLSQTGGHFMKIRSLMIVVSLLCVTGLGSATAEINTLEIVCDRNANESTPYSIFMAANKIGATTCSIETGSDMYTLSKTGDEWFPEQRFLDDHADLSFSGMMSKISGSWVLTWDAENQDTETICTIEFVTFQEEEFPQVPMISMPLDGMTIINPDPNPPTMVWGYISGDDACVAQPDYVAVNLSGPEGSEYESGELDCEILSWTPPQELDTGEWTLEVSNEVSSVQNVPEGLTIVGDPWLLDNSDWLGFRALGVSISNVVPTTVMSFGKIKDLYR